VSVASLWEIAIKVSLRKLTLSKPLDTWMPAELAANSIDLLDISIAHVVQVAALPFIHRDPFDRLLIAQALVENMPITGADAAFDPYGVTRMW
jgi:PIN domain nuclease of toxin-antitoxin system